MGYLHIDNLYKNGDIFLFRECYALEKIHGTSAHIYFRKDNIIIFFSGGSKHSNFIKLFDEKKLLKIYKDNFQGDVKIFGEAYGGKCQGMSDTYGKDLKFIVFDVKIDDNWLDVKNAEDVAKKFGLEFISYNKIKTTIKAIDKEKDSPSIQAKRNGIMDIKKREGIVLRPLIEVIKNNGERIISKHKIDIFRETKKKRIVGEELVVLKEAEKIAEEWVTLNRLKNILSKLDIDVLCIEKTGDIIKLMTEDIYREGKDEVVENSQTKRLIGRHIAIMFKKYIGI